MRHFFRVLNFETIKMDIQKKENNMKKLFLMTVIGLGMANAGYASSLKTRESAFRESMKSTKALKTVGGETSSQNSAHILRSDRMKARYAAMSSLTYQPDYIPQPVSSGATKFEESMAQRAPVLYGE